MKVADVQVEPRHFIGGEPAGGGSKTFEVVSPIDQNVLGEMCAGGAAEIDQAVRAARSAFPAWAAL
ncbi:MAG TPA: aldehyde dehydrogenase family protein, partial [Polyangiaceae bacterium]|nr:aldehyde dehydrogenase family protein [Polyangiaceae bacterium]